MKKKTTPNLKFKLGEKLCDQCSGLGYIIVVGEPSAICNECSGSGKVKGMVVEEDNETIKKAKEGN